MNKSFFLYLKIRSKKFLITDFSFSKNLKYIFELYKKIK